MSIDKKKLINIFNNSDIVIIDYYCIENQCAMIKCFMTKIFDFILIYIPTKLRFNLEKGKNSYNLEILEEDNDYDDYAKTKKNPDIETIDEEKSANVYTEMTKQYKKNIYLEGDDEPTIRKISRQISRMKIPFEKLKYDIAIQNGNILAISFSEDINLFEIKNYFKKNQSILYVINIKDLIENIEKIPIDLDIIRKQYYNIIEKISLTNLEAMSQNLENFNMLKEKLNDRKIKYQKASEEYSEIFNNIKNIEENIVKKYKKIIQVASGVKKTSLENSAEKELNDIFKKKMEIIEKGVDFISKYHLNILIVECISFDTLVMCKRSENNFKVLNKLLL